MNRPISLFVFMIYLTSCATPTVISQEILDAIPENHTPSNCGNGKCNGRENTIFYPQEFSAWAVIQLPPGPSLEPGQPKDTDWLTEVKFIKHRFISSNCSSLSSVSIPRITSSRLGKPSTLETSNDYVEGTTYDPMA